MIRLTVVDGCRASSLRRETWTRAAMFKFYETATDGGGIVKNPAAYSTIARPVNRQSPYRVTPVRKCVFSSQPRHPHPVPTGYERAESEAVRTEEVDFFGEPVTFLTMDDDYDDNDAQSKEVQEERTRAVASYDNFILAYLSRGKTCDGGGDEEGWSAQSAHAFAIAWADLLVGIGRTQRVWDGDDGGRRQVAPMLVIAAVSPLLVQTGVGYVAHLDTLLLKAQQRQRNSKAIQLQSLCESILDTPHENISARESLHLTAFEHLLHHRYPSALSTLQLLLDQHPGDALALYLILEISQTHGDTHHPLRSVSSVSSYWNERSTGNRFNFGILRRGLPGHAVVSSVISLGLAVGGRFTLAERLAELSRSKEGECSGLASLALTHCLEGEGRSSEGVSLLCGYDGKETYEKCGGLFFDSRMAGYGARFALDRDGAGADKVACRVYDDYFGRIMDYWGIRGGMVYEEEMTGIRTAPGNVNMLDRTKAGAKNLFSQFMPLTDEENVTKIDNDADTFEEEKKMLENVLTWLPPTPQILTDATLLLLRLTVSGAITPHDARWVDLRLAWIHLLDIYRDAHADRHSLEECDVKLLSFFPLAQLAADFVVGSSMYENTNDAPTAPPSDLSKGLTLMGELMRIGRTPEISPTDNDDPKHIADQWERVTQHLSAARNQNTQIGWDLDSRVFLEHTLCHAACSTTNYSLHCLARSVCSESVTLRPNNPEGWWRYSVVLKMLGDDVAAEDARAASISFGSGEGGSGAH